MHLNRTRDRCMVTAAFCTAQQLKICGFCQLNCSPNSLDDDFNNCVIVQVVGIKVGVTEGVVFLQHSPAATVLT
jgi:hypothetical protein